MVLSEHQELCSNHAESLVRAQQQWLQNVNSLCLERSGQQGTDVRKPPLA